MQGLLNSIEFPETSAVTDSICRLCNNSLIFWFYMLLIVITGDFLVVRSNRRFF